MKNELYVFLNRFLGIFTIASYIFRHSHRLVEEKIGAEKKMMEQKSGDALKVVPEMTNLLLENDHVRVYDVRFKPGQRATMHTHPNHVIYVLNDGKMKITPSKGKPQEIPLKAGQVIWMDATAHIAENTGKTHVHNLIVELKK